MDLTNWNEKRKVSRLKSSLPIHYDSSAYGKSGATQTHDISECGVSIVCEEFMPRSSRMSLQINLAANKFVGVDGEVKWANRIAHSYWYRVGLEFKDMPQEYKRSICEFVQRLSQQAVT